MWAESKSVPVDLKLGTRKSRLEDDWLWWKRKAKSAVPGRRTAESPGKDVECSNSAEMLFQNSASGGMVGFLFRHIFCQWQSGGGFLAIYG